MCVFVCLIVHLSVRVFVCLNRRVIVSKRAVTLCLASVSALQDGLDFDAIKVTLLSLSCI